MPKKAAKRKLDVAQRTLFQFSAFKQSKSVASSRPKAPDSHRAKRRKSDSTTPYSGSSRLYQEQEATNRVRETPKQSQSLLQTPSMQVPVEFRSIAQVELRKSLQTLNREQKAAVDAPWRSPIAVFAGAGTGKTTALIARIWNMVTQGITPESILAITFTRKACQEIKDRLSVDKLGCKVPVNVFTFHGWAIRFLRMKRIREMAGVPKTLVIWAPRDQKEHMAQACQRARVDHELLPQARRVMGLPVTGQTSPDESWKELLCKAFTDPAIRNSVLCARERAKDRVKAALKEVASPEKDADQEDGELETKDASAEYARQHAGTANAYPVEKTSTSIVQQYGSLSGPAAAPGASTKPSAKLRHIHTTPKVLAAVDGGLSDSDAEEADIGNEHLKSSHRSGCGHWVEILFPDGSIDTWTLVAKELLTTYCRQECGIEIIVSKQGSSSGVGKAARDRIIHHRKHFLFHKAPADGAPAHATKLDPAAIKAKASALVQFRDWIRKNNAEGLEPETFQTVANKYYDARMKLLGALDFDEMLALVEHLLDTNVEACGIARTMYQHLLVDEFQDSNAVQIRIVKHLQDGRGHLTVVGDDAQSIYGFRGATNRAFLLLSDMLEDCSLQEYSMTQNYRSLAPIIEVGNCVLKNLMSCGALVQKDLTCTRTGHANPVSYHVLGTGLDEARFIVSEIKQLHDEHRYKYDDMAIICRLNNNRSLFAHEFGVLHHIKMQLAKDAIPHRVFRGRQMTEKPEYVLTMDVLKFLTNPLNDGALLAILESKLSMKAGIGESVVTQLKQIVRDSNQPVPVWNSLQDLVRRHDTATRKRNAVKRLLEWYSRVYGQVMFMSLPEAMLYIWTESGISALAGKNRKKSGASPAEDNAPTSVVSDHSHQPDISFSRQDTAQMSQHSGLSAADVLRTPAKKHKTPKSPAPDATINILTSPTLEALHKNSQEFLAEWTADSLFLERFGELRLAPSAMGSTREPSSLLSLATAAVMQLPQTQRVNAVNILATANPGLADLILSVNKCGYGPVADFLQHLDLNSSSVAEEDDSDAHADDGKVTLSTVHGCKGLEWPVVFVPKFIDNVMPLKFYLKRAIPVDSNEEAGCEDMAIAAVQADARIRGTLLKTHDDVVAYLPEWLKQDGLELEVEDDMNSGSESRDDLRPHFLHNDPEQVSRCYKRKKEKQHDEEEIRLAHVAFTRAKDRLYVTSHRIAEGSADASSLEAAIASDTRAVKRVDPSKFIPLLDSSEAMTRTCHPIDAVEEYLGRCATQNDMRQGIRHLGNAWQTQQAIGLVAGAEGAASQGAVHPVSAAVAAAEAVVQDASAHAASAFHFMGAAKHELQPSNNSVSKFPDCAPALHVAPGGSSSGHANPESQLRAGGIHSRPFGRRVPPMQTGQSFGLSYSDDGPPLPMRRCIAMNASADASTSRPLQTTGSTSKASTPSRHGAGSSHGVIRSGSPAALRGLPPAAVAGHNGESRRVSVERVSGQQGYARPGASAGHDLLIDLTSPRAVGRDSTSQAANSTGKGVADHMHASKAASMTKKLPRVHAGYKSQAKSVHFRAPRRNT